MNRSSGNSEGVQEPPPSKERTRTRYILSVSLLILVLLGSSIFLLLRNGPPSAVVGRKTTPTPMATSPVVITPTAAAFYDTFIDNRHGWSLANGNGFMRTLTNSTLTLANLRSHTTLVESLPDNNSYRNFKLVVDFTLVKAGANDSTGVYVRGDSNLDHDYRVDINSNNTIDIAKEYLDTNGMPRSIIQAGPFVTPALHRQGLRNTLIVVMNEAEMTLFVNDVKVGSMIDTDYPTGLIALFAHNGGNSKGVTVSFFRIELDQLPSITPTPTTSNP